jgi:dihydrofolate reductase
MGQVVLDMTMSLNGCVSGPGDTDAGLHDWYFSPTSGADAVIAETIRTTGAMVMGRRTYDLGAGQGGFKDNPYQVDHVVLCHQPPSEVAEGNTSFVFVTDGIEAAVARAKSAAGDRNVVIGGGATTARLSLNARLVDLIKLAVVPVVIRGGLPLFDGLDIELQLAAGPVSATTPDVTHLSYTVVK